MEEWKNGKGPRWCGVHFGVASVLTDSHCSASQVTAVESARSILGVRHNSHSYREGPSANMTGRTIAFMGTGKPIAFMGTRPCPWSSVYQAPNRR